MAEQPAKKKRKKTLWQVIFGVRRPGEKYFYDYSLVFAVVFLTAVAVGFMPIGFELGKQLDPLTSRTPSSNPEE